MEYYSFTEQSVYSTLNQQACFIIHCIRGNKKLKKINTAYLFGTNMPPHCLTKYTAYILTNCNDQLHGTGFLSGYNG